MLSLRFPSNIALRLAAILSAGFAAQSQSQAQVLLRFNLSDPTHAVVSATSNPPNISTPVTDGEVFLTDFFGNRGWQEANGYMVGNLAPTSQPASGFENNNRSFNYWSCPDGVALILHSRNGGTFTWTPEVAPFAGTAIMDLSYFNNFGTILSPTSLPANGATGNIWGADKGVVGSWLVDNSITPIPEPAAGASLVGGLLAAYLVIRRSLGKMEKGSSGKSPS